MCRLLIEVALVVKAELQGTRASVVATHGLRSYNSWALDHSLNSCGARAELLYNMWDLPG